MSLAPGARLGPYEIVSLLGAGGMGEVYKAVDTRLGRTVAIKVLPAPVAADPILRQRFEREACAVAALNHPHICTLHDVGDEGGIVYLVMEYLDGETLAQRLTRGALPLDQTLRLAIEIADALDKAHRQGIVHRDLKPGNVMVTRSGGRSSPPRATLLDFGLARLMGPSAVSSLSMAATQDGPMTAQGTILGTVQYMAPEQLEGRDADTRSDIFAFGALVYEMLTGKKAFDGTSQASLISAIMTAAPAPITSSQPLTPAVLDRIVTKCLAKDRDERWQSAHDLRSELKWVAETAAGPILPQAESPRARQRWWLLTVAATLVGLGTLSGAWLFGRLSAPPVPAGAVTRFTVSAPEGVDISIYSKPAVSPDGRSVAFVGSRPGETSRIWLRALDEVAARALAGTNNSENPFWSPDGSFIGFYSEGQLKKVPVAGGPPETLCDAPFRGGESFGGTWSPDGTILFSTSGGLQRVSESGGTPAVVTKPDQSQGETAHLWPQFLPDGRRFLYSAAMAGSDQRIAFVGSLDSPERRRLMDVRSNVAYVPGGHVLFIRQGTLLTQEFDMSALELRGEPVSIADNLASSNASFGVSRDTLTYLTATRSTTLAWFDRSGKELRKILESGEFFWPALSPDDRRIAIDRVDADAGTRAIWVLDDVRGGASRLTLDPTEGSDAVWSPDGRRIVFGHDVGRALHEIGPDGGGGARVLLQFGRDQVYPTDWSADGRLIAYTGFGPTGSADVWLVPVDGVRKPVPFAATKFHEGQARIAPDSRWIAYTSDESGRPEVYIRTRTVLSGAGQHAHGGAARVRHAA